MNYISLSQVIIFFVYLYIVKRKFGILPSISQSYYEFLKLKYSVAFVIFTWSIALGMFLQTVYDFKLYTEFVFIFSGIFMAFLGIAAPFRQKEVNVYHYVCSVIAIATGFLALIIQDWPKWYAFIPLPLYVASIVWMKKKKWINFTWWTEVAAFSIIFARLLIRP